MKAVSPLVGFVLTIFVSVMTMGLVYFGIKPAIERSIANNVMSEARGNLELLASTIERVASGAEGSKSVVSLLVSDGEYFIDKNSNNIIFTFNPSVDLGVIGRIGDKFLEKGSAFFDFFNNYLDNSLPNNLINVSGNWRVYNNRLEGINGTAYYFIDKNLNGFYVASNFGSDNNLGQIFVSPVNLSNLVLYLTFDEESGNIAYDYSGNGNNGTIYGAIWVDGKFGKALSFDGVDDYVNCGSGSSLQLTNEVMGMVWINPRAVSLDRAGVITSKPSNRWRLWYNTDGRVYAEFRDSTGNWFYTNFVAVPQNAWTQVAFYYNLATGKYGIFVNGVKYEKSHYGNPLYSGTDTIYIGADYPTANRYFNGTIDEVHIYNRALSEEEIKFLYQEGLKKLQNSGMLQFNSQIKPYIAISNPSGKIYVENLRVGNQNSREIKLIKPFYGLEFNSNFRFSKGNHQIKIENIGFNSTSKRPIIRISKS